MTSPADNGKPPAIDQPTKHVGTAIAQASVAMSERSSSFTSSGEATVWAISSRSTCRIRQPMTPDEAMAVIRLLTAMSVLEIDATLVQSAIVCRQQHRISYWDTLIVATAERAHCARLFSEDLNAGQRYGGVVVENPFA